MNPQLFAPEPPLTDPPFKVKCMEGFLISLINGQTYTVIKVKFQGPGDIRYFLEEVNSSLGWYNTRFRRI